MHEGYVPVKALSVVHPAGSRIAAGLKVLEVRRWHPGFLPSEDLLIVENDRFLLRDGEEDPNGRAVAIVRVARVRPFREDMAAACAASYEAGWLAWELVDIRPVRSSSVVLAARHIYEVGLPSDIALRQGARRSLRPQEDIPAAEDCPL
jgi:hypothetical protein